MRTHREKAGGQGSDLFSGQRPPSSSFSPPFPFPSHSPLSAPTFLPLLPSEYGANWSVATGRQGTSPAPPELPILLCTSSKLAPLPRFQLDPLLLSPTASTVIRLPIRIPGLKASFWARSRRPWILLLKWLPGQCTLALRQLRTWATAAGPPPGLSVSGGTQHSRAFSLHGVGHRHPSTPQIKPAGCLRGKWGGRAIQVQRHGDGGSGWSRALAGEGSASAAARGCKEERGRRAPSARLHRPPPPHPSQGFRSGTSPPRLLAPAPFSVFIPNPKKTATSQPARPAREPTVKTPVLWPCPCPRDPTRGAGSAPHPPRTARSSASGSFASSAWTLCGNLEPPKIRH